MNVKSPKITMTKVVEFIPELITAPNTPATIQAGLLDRVILLLKKIDMGDIIPPQELAKLNAEYARLLARMDRATFDALVEYDANIIETWRQYNSVKADIKLGFNIQ